MCWWLQLAAGCLHMSTAVILKSLYYEFPQAEAKLRAVWNESFSTMWAVGCLAAGERGARRISEPATEELQL